MKEEQLHKVNAQIADLRESHKAEGISLFTVNHELGQLKIQLAAIMEQQGEARRMQAALMASMAERTPKLRALEDTRKRLEDEIMNGHEEVSTEPSVTDHAMVRYLERVYDLDLKDLSNKILTPTVLKYASALGGSGKFPDNDGGFTVIMKNYKVVTVVPQGSATVFSSGTLGSKPKKWGSK